jgi:hypothetical protein
MKNISLAIAIDTNSIKVANPTPSTDPLEPTKLAGDDEFIVVTGTTVVSGQGTGEVEFLAAVGDQIMLFGLSGSDNFDDAVLFYRVQRGSGDRVFGTFTDQVYTTSTVTPSADPTVVLPPQLQADQFWFYQAGVRQAGTAECMIRFGLWARDPQTGDPVLFGYFESCSRITIVMPPPVSVAGS